MTLWRPAMIAMRTSLWGSRVKRFVIERFAPSCLVDIVPVGERVTSAPRDAVDSIMSVEDWGRVRDRGNVQERQARRDQEDANTEGA